jgi:hypothetical protein
MAVPTICYVARRHCFTGLGLRTHNVCVLSAVAHVLAVSAEHLAISMSSITGSRWRRTAWERMRYCRMLATPTAHVVISISANPTNNNIVVKKPMTAAPGSAGRGTGGVGKRVGRTWSVDMYFGYDQGSGPRAGTCS